MPVTQGSLWVGEERGVPQSRNRISFYLPRHLVGIGIICQWPLRPPVLTLMSLVSCQLEDWLGPLASQGFLAGGHGFFCLLPELLTFEGGPLAALIGEGLGSCSFWLTASWCLTPHLAASAQSPRFSPSLKITVLLHPLSKSSQSNKACPEPWLLPGLSVWGSDSCQGQREGSGACEVGGADVGSARSAQGGSGY